MSCCLMWILIICGTRFEKKSGIFFCLKKRLFVFFRSVVFVGCQNLKQRKEKGVGGGGGGRGDVTEAAPQLPPPDGVVVVGVETRDSFAASAAAVTEAADVRGLCTGWGSWGRVKGQALKAATAYWMISRGPNRKQPLQVSSGLPMKWA